MATGEAQRLPTSSNAFRQTGSLGNAGRTDAAHFYMQILLEERPLSIKRAAESDEWSALLR